MKILLFINSLKIGGAQNQFVALVQQWKLQGVDFSTAVLNTGGQYWDILHKHDIQVNVLFEGQGKTFFKRLLQLVIAPYKLRRLIKKKKITHVYSMLEFSNLLMRVALLWESKVKLIWGVRISDLQQIKMLYPKMYYAEKCCALLSCRTNLVICNSSKAIKEYKNFFKCFQYELIMNGVDITRFHKDSSFRNEFRKNCKLNQIVIGIAARITPQKNYETLFEAIRILLKTWGKVTLLVVGSGEKEYVDSLLELARKLGLEEYIYWAGELREQLVSAYNAMDIFCLPSFMEGCSNSILEAMACELPCVVTDVGDSKRIVGDENGICISEEVKDLVLQLTKFLNFTSKQREEIGLNNRKRVMENFSLEHMANDTLTKIQKL